MVKLPKIVIKSEEKRLVYGEVYSPNHVDTDGEAMTAEHIERMAHKFLKNRRTTNVDVGHDQKASCVMVESFIARNGDPDGFIEGAWVAGVEVPPELWAKVKSGELNGFSWQGGAEKVRRKAVISITRKLSGSTEKSAKGLLPEHAHDLELAFSADGELLPSQTSESLGHRHEVIRATATEKELDHSHRLILIEN